jgi:hypothetical protein
LGLARVLHDLQFGGLVRAEAVPHGSSSGTLGRSTAPHSCLSGRWTAVCRPPLFSCPGVPLFLALALPWRCDIKRRGRGRRPVPRTRTRTRAIAEAFTRYGRPLLLSSWGQGKARQWHACICPPLSRARDGTGSIKCHLVSPNKAQRSGRERKEGRKAVRLLRARSNAVCQLAIASLSLSLSATVHTRRMI